MFLYLALATHEERYKVQNFIDTVVFRGGDVASVMALFSSRRRPGLCCE
jgi:hypothetical protein